YFIEVNARIQVEHPVSESVTGVDLIQQQIRVAAGEKLDLKQKSIPCNGASIEVRINAEDPANGFRPCPGTIKKLRLPGGPGVRFDSHVYEGYTISPYYDSMIGKLIVHRPTRDEAIKTAIRALDEFVIEGIQTTIPLAKRILEHNTFQSGSGDTSFVERTF
ncbi:MAG: acetyl-CoA carboxylase biotin carboxylase subunit, partial [Planctomycetaceae bacterium]